VVQQSPIGRPETISQKQFVKYEILVENISYGTSK
jgi:hypothetical protein